MAAHDQGFVPAPPATVYGLLAEPASYPSWWPGTAASGDGRVTLPLGGRPQVTAPEALREGIGLVLRLAGSAPGTLEWYLEPTDGGTMVNCVLDVNIRGGPRRSSRVLLHMRAAVRRGLVGLRRALG